MVAMAAAYLVNIGVKRRKRERNVCSKRRGEKHQTYLASMAAMLAMRSISENRRHKINENGMKWRSENISSWRKSAA